MAALLWPGVDPTTYNKVSNTSQDDGQFNGTLGTIYDYYHSTYGKWRVRLVQFKDAVTYAAGQSLQWYDAAKTQVTNDRSGGTGLSFGAAGICLMVNTTAYFGLILTRGKYPTVITNGDDDIAAGDAIIISSTDGKCDSGTSTPGLYLGNATAADVDADDTVAAFINVIDNSY